MFSLVTMASIAIYEQSLSTLLIMEHIELIIIFKIFFDGSLDDHLTIVRTNIYEYMKTICFHFKAFFLIWDTLMKFSQQLHTFLPFNNSISCDNNFNLPTIMRKHRSCCFLSLRRDLSSGVLGNPHMAPQNFVER
ncbi:CLUMA_CG013968, isoform A [Clunio marinus]|uniref:CLUMA_CG013968, isoform A n=1 Tax=Clunio marinus TaxID=568069 RepID=A0A1J1IKE9_9DIPT|nr:CLUMA_CG013968, isoform A [Clunio marinus]